jgi:diguanylate cyclase (GGDEF)-like protein
MKILVADDSLVMRRLLEATLAGWGYEVVTARDGEEAWAVLCSEDAPHLAVLDWMMPTLSGLELCRKVRALARARYTYLILLTSKGLREDVVEGLTAGADDYVVKPFDKYELEVRLRAGRRIVELQAELLETQDALREQATRDSLTAVWNRRTILEILDREVHRSAREGTVLGLLMLDIDHFKEVNDTFGHQVGDEVLRAVAARLVSAMRSYDSIGRYGGEEFLVVVPGCGGAALLAQANRLRFALASLPVEIGGHVRTVTASVGATALEGRPDITVEGLIRAADAALYQAKSTGRNAAVFSAPAAVHLPD